MCQDSDVRLLVGEDYEYYYGGETLDSSYYIDNQLSVGRLELCLNRQWGVACQDYWNNEQASVVCNQLGFARVCLLYTSPSPRDATLSRMPSSA